MSHLHDKSSWPSIPMIGGINISGLRALPMQWRHQWSRGNDRYCCFWSRTQGVLRHVFPIDLKVTADEEAMAHKVLKTDVRNEQVLGVQPQGDED